MKPKVYESPRAFRAALEDRLNRIAKTEGIDILRLRRQVAFDRLLARFFAEANPPWALKGGYAMQLRIESARATKDVDLAVRDAKLLSDNESERIDALLELLQASARKDLGDFFEFQIGPSVMELDGAPYGGSRFVVEVRVDGRVFERFDLDVGVGDVWIEPLENLKSNDYLAFAGFGSQIFPSISREQQFAEKLHAYTRPRPEGRPNSRVKDLVDMNLLIQHGLKIDFLATALKETFKRRGTHALDLNVQPPPTAWSTTFRTMAEDCEIEPDIEVGFRILADFLKTI